jgi:phosphoglycerate dehydrogenase-like enzyme
VAEKPAPSVLHKAEPDPALRDAEIIFGQPDPIALMSAKNLVWVHLTSAGFTRYDTEDFRRTARERGLILTNSSSVYARPCAEHVFAFMLAQSRCLPRSLESRFANGSPSWQELRHAAKSLREQNVLLLGFGAIARLLIKLMAPFEMKIVGFRRKPAGDEGVEMVSPDNLGKALAAADHVINILPENRDSAHFFSTDKFSQMKRGAVFYNIGRGATVDQDALLEALRSNHLAAAWLDVTSPEPLPSDHPLLKEPNCFITPHVAGGHSNEPEMLVRHFLENLGRFAQHLPMTDRIM